MCGSDKNGGGIERMNQGRVYLVGAGPGDPGLFTIKGQKLIENAQVVVYDRLVGDEILSQIPETAEKINVGKTAGRHPVPQEEISRILVEKAQAGKIVVRIKGGDPFLFGRGGEELELLRQCDIPFEVVPGITSAIAVPCYAGIPVTHRDCCSSLHIITGHAKKDGELHIDFDALVRLQGTLVFLMSVSSMRYILDGLAQAGMNTDVPAAVIENGTLPNQRKTVAMVGTLAKKAEEVGVKSPATLIVGDVCAYHTEFDWFEKLPLHGKTILVTRPQNRAGTLSGRLTALGARVIPYHCIETEEIRPNNPAMDALLEIESYGWLVLTSPAGAESLRNLLEVLVLDARALAPVKIAVIGKATEEALMKIGLRADFVPETYDAVHLAKGLRLLAKEGERILLLRAEKGTEALTEVLEDSGIYYDDIPVYRTHYRSENSKDVGELLCRGAVDYVTFTSASTVTGFVQSLSEVDFTKVRGVCIGASTEAAAKQYGIQTICAGKADISALIEAIVKEEDEHD